MSNFVAWLLSNIVSIYHIPTVSSLFSVITILKCMLLWLRLSSNNTTTIPGQKKQQQTKHVTHINCIFTVRETCLRTNGGCIMALHMSWGRMCMIQRLVTCVRGVYLFFCACLQMVGQKNTKTAPLHKSAEALVHYNHQSYFPVTKHVRSKQCYSSIPLCVSPHWDTCPQKHPSQWSCPHFQIQDLYMNEMTEYKNSILKEIRSKG